MLFKLQLVQSKISPRATSSYISLLTVKISVSAELSLILCFIKKIDMEEGFILMNLSKYKRWRSFLHIVIAKQQPKREQTHPVCLHAVEKYEKVESVIHNDYETMSKK